LYTYNSKMPNFELWQYSSRDAICRWSNWQRTGRPGFYPGQTGTFLIIPAKPVSYPERNM
jgi:hypothetical protein